MYKHTRFAANQGLAMTYRGCIAIPKTKQPKNFNQSITQPDKQAVIKPAKTRNTKPSILREARQPPQFAQISYFF